MAKFKLSEAKKIANITFEGTDFDGLEVKCTLDLPLKVVLDIQRLSQSDDNDDKLEANTIWCDKVLLSWNLVNDKGEDIPANANNALMEVPSRILNALIVKWSELVTEPSANLSKPQNDTHMLENLADQSTAI
tara:strand:- start:2045 stop:2443 length:399 start_codon:yes stop_codon:yes gene_type:complete